jgi:hypothetical protein
MNIKSYTEWLWKGARLNARALKFDERGWPILPANWVNSPEQGFLKFFGRGSNRLERSSAIIAEVMRAGCHWACTYSKAPRQPKDGSTIFMGRYVKSPDDVLIFGRARGMQHVDGRDRASPADLEERRWKEDWPFYIRVVNPEFIDGEFSHGVSLNELMKELWSETFASTYRRAAETGRKDIDPKDSLPQQTQLELTPRAIRCLSDRLEQCFKVHGRIGNDDVARLDWPTI